MTARDQAQAKLTLTALLGAVARRAPETPALIYGARRVGFAELDGLSRRVAQGLAELGVGAGDRVALWLPNVPAWFTLYLACARLGAIAVAVNTRFRSAEVEDLVGRSGAKVLALMPGFKAIDFAAILDAVDGAALEGLETVIVCDEEGSAPAPAPGLGLGLERRVVRYADLESRPPHERDRARPEAGCAIFTTSGTTKAPKLVLHSQAAVVAHARQVARAFGYDADDAVMLQALPLCGVFGFCQAMASLASGRPMVLMPSFEPESAARLVHEHRVTHSNGSDDMFQRLLAAGAGPRPFPSLRLAGFADFNPALDDIVGQAEGRGLTLVGLYGMSEVQALFARQKVDAEAGQRARAGGFPVAPEAEVRVREPESGALLGPGENGELELKGPSRMVGYYGDPQATAEALTEDGFVRSGDLGHIASDGSFVFLSRMGDVLRLGGFLVSPAEIETFIQAHGSVDGCQVVGVTPRPGVPGGVRPVAFVTLPPGAAFDEAALKAFCANGMAGYKVPLRFVALEAFPVTTSANGTKIQRARLRQMAATVVATIVADARAAPA